VRRSSVAVFSLAGVCGVVGLGIALPAYAGRPAAGPAAVAPAKPTKWVTATVRPTRTAPGTPVPTNPPPPSKPPTTSQSSAPATVKPATTAAATKTSSPARRSSPSLRPRATRSRPLSAVRQTTTVATPTEPSGTPLRRTGPAYRVETYSMPPPPPESTTTRAPIEEADQQPPPTALSARSVTSTGKELALLVVTIGGAALLGVVGLSGLYATRERPVDDDWEAEPE